TEKFITKAIAEAIAILKSKEKRLEISSSSSSSASTTSSKDNKGQSDSKSSGSNSGSSGKLSSLKPDPLVKWSDQLKAVRQKLILALIKIYLGISNILV
ncbi:9643_t:CDS:2, partial [Racocetra fulgida]